MRRPNFSLLSLASLFSALVIGVGTAHAYEQYSEARDATLCRACHGDFRASPYTSLSDGTSWGDDLHDVHRYGMLDGDCDTCHGGSFFPVLLDSSSGGTGIAAISCAGCHGRAEDGAGFGTVGYAAGLRQHHWVAGETICGDCHDDSNPSGFTPVGEDVLPPFYSASPTDQPLIPTDPCNPEADGFPEDYAATTLGLDNDGDDSYDEADADCAAPTPTATPTATPSGSPTATPSGSPTATPTPTPSPTPSPGNECQCVPRKIVPRNNLTVLQNTNTLGKRSTRTRNVGVILKAIEQTRGACRPNTSMDTFSLRLQMVDDDGDVILDETRTDLPCNRRVGRERFMATFEVENCADSEAPTKMSLGEVTVTATTEDGELITSRIIKCKK